MSQLFDPDLLARARDGEDVWEWRGDDQVAFQSRCSGCRGGIVATAGIGAEYCGTCGGDGWLVRIELRRPSHTPADPGADECADAVAGEFERDLREYGVEL